MAEQQSLLKRLGISSEELIGYTYSGVLILLVALAVNPSAIRGLRDAVGDFVFLFALFGWGIGAYVIYRRVLGEFFVYPMRHAMHWIWDRGRGKLGSEHTSCTAYLGFLGVRPGQRRSAYYSLRNRLTEEGGHSRIDLAHGEIHVLYLTAFAAFFAWLLEARPLLPPEWLILSVISYIAALVEDIWQLSQETYFFKRHGESRLRDLLQERGFVLETNPNQVQKGT